MEKIPLYCDVCNKEFSGVVPAKQHFEGASHLKRVQNLTQSRHSGKPFCVICNKACDTTHQLELHCESPQHKANATKRSYFQQGACDTAGARAEPGQAKDQVYDFDGQRGICYVCQIEFTSAAHAKDHLNGDKHHRKVKQKSNEKPLACNACGVTFSGPENASEHFRSEKHKKKYKEQELLQRGEALPLSCNTCRVTFSGQETARTHFESQKHARNVENSLKQTSNTNDKATSSYVSPPAFPDYVSLTQIEHQMNALTGSEFRPSNQDQFSVSEERYPSRTSDTFPKNTVAAPPSSRLTSLSGTYSGLTGATSLMEWSPSQVPMSSYGCASEPSSFGSEQPSLFHQTSQQDRESEPPVNFIRNDLGLTGNSISTLNVNTLIYERNVSQNSASSPSVHQTGGKYETTGSVSFGLQPTVQQSELASERVPQTEYIFNTGAERGYCNLCKIDLTSVQHRDQHVKGGKHMKAALVWRQLREREAGLQHVCLLTFSGPEAQAQHFSSERHKRKVEDEKMKIVPGESQYPAAACREMPAVPTSHSSDTMYTTDRTVWYTCDVCHCSMNSPEQLNIHKKSQRHLLMVQKQGRSGSNETGSTTGTGGLKYSSQDSLPAPMVTEQTAVKYVSNPAAYSGNTTNAINRDIYSPSGVSWHSQSIESTGATDSVLDPTSRQSESPSPGARPVVDVEITTDSPICRPLKMATVFENSPNRTGVANGRRSHGTDMAWETRNRHPGTKSRIACQDQSTSQIMSPSSHNPDNVQISPFVTGNVGVREGLWQGPADLSNSTGSPNTTSITSTYPSHIYKFYCHTCKSPMNTREVLEAHNKGKRHLAKVATEPAPEREHLVATKLSREQFNNPSTKTVPRNYQKELYHKAAIKDRLCFLPTGTGKTLVSVMLMDLMLRIYPSKQIVFLVDKVLLVLQQARCIQSELMDNIYNRFDTDTQSCRETVNRHLRVAMLCGGQQSTQGVPLWKHDIIVVTAAFCDNLLQKKILRWGDISLVVIDEAHHCEKNHPFNKLLKGHHLPNPPALRPKVLALTASPAGKATIPLTLSMLKSLTANLGDVSMAIVQEHENTLRKYQSNAEIIVIQSHEDQEQAKADFVYELQVYLAHCYIKLAEISNITDYCDNEVSSFTIARDVQQLAPDFIRKHLETIQCSLEMCRCKQNGTDSRVMFSLLQNHVRCACMAYNCLLEGGIPCAVEAFTASDSVHQCSSDFDIAKKFGLPCLPLIKLLNINKTASCAQKPGSQILHLIETLTNGRYINWRQPGQPLALVLVKERATASRLSSMLNETEAVGGKGLRVACVVGHGSGGAEAGMRVNQQKKVLDEIKQYKYQVIMATSVAEEGVDWPECELVVSMYPPSTVTSLVQMRGRARKKNSKFIILCGDPNQAEKLNETMEKERVMMTASKLFVKGSMQAGEGY